MAALFLFLILIMGYYYASNSKIAKINLRRSAGWETYVYLGFHGTCFVLLGVLICAVMYLPVWIILSFFDWLFNAKLNLSILKFLKYIIFDGIQIYHVIISFLAYGVCKAKINEENSKQDLSEQLKQLSQNDGVVNLVLESAYKQKPIRVSLKSKKVYVGLVLAEQFERIDLDCIVLVPLLSGYRDKDTLDIFFDCNYYSVYEKNKLFERPEFSKDDMLKLEDFRLAIRISEVESVSLFDFRVIGEFERYKKEEVNT